MNHLICTEDAPCWMPGLGFRWLKDTGSTCAIDDEPMTKFDSMGTDPMSALRLWFDGPDAQAIVVQRDGPQPAPVPLNGAGAYLGGTLIAALMIAAAWKIMPWLEAQKGESGWP